MKLRIEMSAEDIASLALLAGVLVAGVVTCGYYLFGG